MHGRFMATKIKRLRRDKLIINRAVHGDENSRDKLLEQQFSYHCNNRVYARMRFVGK